MLKINKFIALLIAVFMIIAVFAGCGAKDGNTAKDNSVAAVQETPAQAQQEAQAKAQEDKKDAEVYPLKVKDFNGFEITIEKKPESIVSLTLGTDEMLLSLVDKSRIKALSGKIAEDEGISNVADKAKEFPKAEQNVETVISLKPDIVFAASWMKKEAIQQMRDAKIPVYCYGTATNIEEQKKVILEIAHILGEDAKGREIAADMDKKLKEMEEKVKTLKPEEKLTVLSYNSYGTTYGKGTTFDDIVTRAGLVNAAAKAGLEGYPKISKEKIVELNPDVIILPAWSYDKKQDPAAFADEIKKDKSLASVNAIKNNRVYMLPDKHMSCVSQYIVLGVEDVAKAVYPQLFK